MSVFGNYYYSKEDKHPVYYEYYTDDGKTLRYFPNGQVGEYVRDVNNKNLLHLINRYQYDPSKLFTEIGGRRGHSGLYEEKYTSHRRAGKKIRTDIFPNMIPIQTRKTSPDLQTLQTVTTQQVTTTPISTSSTAPVATPAALPTEVATKKVEYITDLPGYGRVNPNWRYKNGGRLIYFE